MGGNVMQTRSLAFHRSIQHAGCIEELNLYDQVKIFLPPGEINTPFIHIGDLQLIRQNNKYHISW